MSVSGRLVVEQPDPPRLDAWLAATQPALSRARWQALIAGGQVTVNGQAAKANRRLRAGDTVAFEIPPPEPTDLKPEAIPVTVLYEDADLVVIDKPVGLVVHPAPGHAGGTLVNALLHHCDDLEGVGGEVRPGIVHRLDRDTSGVMVAAKNETALDGLARQFKAREVTKEYLALVRGHPSPAAGVIRTLFGRNPRDRKKMSAAVRRGRNAVTHYATLEVFPGAAALRIQLETGRTHQIRVHLAHIGHPVIGDAVYGRVRRDEWPAPAERQMLHAARLAFVHPRTGESMEFAAPLPPDFAALLAALRARSSPPMDPQAGGRIQDKRPTEPTDCTDGQDTSSRISV